MANTFWIPKEFQKQFILEGLCSGECYSRDQNPIQLMGTPDAVFPPASRCLSQSGFCTDAKIPGPFKGNKALGAVCMCNSAQVPSK